MHGELAWMDRFLIKRSAAPVDEPLAKRTCTKDIDASVAGNVPAAPAGNPRTIISWNVNGLVPQLKNAWPDIQSFLAREKPDVLCLQEVRFPARAPKGAKRGDGQRRQRGVPDRETKQNREDWELVERTIIAATKTDYEIHWSLADYRYSGTAVFIRRGLNPQSIRFTLPALTRIAKHRDSADLSVHPEGRIILVSFASFDLLATYSPNNGSDDTSFSRRSLWDAGVKEDLASWNRPLIWIGDINCAPALCDVSEPEWFLRQCYQGDLVRYRGQPGVTEGEREQFKDILSTARLVDAYRALHPASTSPPADGPFYTWRGHPPVNGVYAKYHGKGMRIDHALVAESLLSSVQACEILGRGADRIGFMGSDHSPLKLVLAFAGGNEEMVRPDEA